MKWWCVFGLVSIALGNVFESDHRVPVSSFPVQLPFARMVGKLISGQNGLCTAFTVGPSHILTTGRCVLNPDQTVKEAAKQRLSFILNGESALVVKIYKATTGSDYVILQLDKAFGDQFGTLPLIGAPACSIALATSYLNVFSVQYARPMYENEPAIQSHCKLNITTNEKCLHSCDTSAIGSTGAPLLYSIRNGTSSVSCVVAMHQVGIDETPLNANGEHWVSTYSKNTANIGIIVVMANAHLSSILAAQTTILAPTTAPPTSIPLTSSLNVTSIASTAPNTIIPVVPSVENNIATNSPASESSSNSSSVNTTTVVYICITVVVVVWIIVLGCMIRRRLLQRNNLLTPA